MRQARRQAAPSRRSATHARGPRRDPQGARHHRTAAAAVANVGVPGGTAAIVSDESAQPQGGGAQGREGVKRDFWWSGCMGTTPRWWSGACPGGRGAGPLRVKKGSGCRTYPNA
eukprot:3551673-Prymnesium_polylepis.1